MNTPTPKRDWKAYYNAVAARPPRKTLLTALAAFKQPGIAIDLGCGDGRDTVEILRQNWTVLAVDKEPEAITRLLARPQLARERLTTRVVSFEELQLPQPVDLINASFSLLLFTRSFSSLVEANLQFFSYWWQILRALIRRTRFLAG